MNELKLYEEPKAKLIVNRRAIAAGLAALIATPVPGRALERKLDQLTNVPLSPDLDSFRGMWRDGVFLPNYRSPMARILFEDGSGTGWQTWLPNHTRRKGVSYNGHIPARDIRAVAIECCAPDKNGMPRYAQLAIG